LLDLSAARDAALGAAPTSTCADRFSYLHVYHWNFNVRFPNPGGNHGAFFRLSTHAVWMVAGGGIAAKSVEESLEWLSVASTMLALVGKVAPMPDRVV
jgi:hypothetical protein